MSAITSQLPVHLGRLFGTALVLAFMVSGGSFAHGATIVSAGGSFRIGSSPAILVNSLSNGASSTGQSNAVRTFDDGCLFSSAYTFCGDDPLADLCDLLGSSLVSLGSSSTSSVSRSSASGPSGKAEADATSTDGLIDYLHAHAAAQVGSTSVVEARTSIGGSLAGYDIAKGLQSAAFAVGMPTDDVVAPLFAGHPNSLEVFGPGSNTENLAVALLGGRYSLSACDPLSPHTYCSSIDLQVDLNQLESPQHLLLGLLDSVGLCDGFDALRFTVVREGTVVIDELFNTLAAATSYFDDQVFDLGPIGADVGPDKILDLTLKFDLTISQECDGFYARAIVGNGAEIVPVPEPSTLALTLVGGLSLIVVGGRKARGRQNRHSSARLRRW